METNLPMPGKFQNVPCPHDPAISLLVIFPTEILTQMHLYTCIKMFRGIVMTHIEQQSLGYIYTVTA